MLDNADLQQDELPRPKFEALDRTETDSDIRSADDGGEWLTILDGACTFPPNIFHEIMLNLIKNPNITSSHLFRADTFYDSGEFNDLSCEFGSSNVHDLRKHLKTEYQPRDINLPGWKTQRTIVRQLIPRNPLLDRPLIQTCHFLARQRDHIEQNAVIYCPHVDDPESMPFYHPAVAKVAFSHTWRPSSTSPGTISVSYSLFPGTSMTTKLSRTALRLLQIMFKHGQGQLAGYTKRVHLDRIIPQKRYQDTYTRLKGIYGRRLAEQWVEVTDPGKHVFEDIGIAAFLIELWNEMYEIPTPESKISQSDDKYGRHGNTPFPGFVDIGCGNGLLVYILLSEGYDGWGFDARQRKTWSIFPERVRAKLDQKLLVPTVLQANHCDSESHSTQTKFWHNGNFTSHDAKTSPARTDSQEGPFIISNHADELTLWTPLLASLNNASFIAIPCCSHDFSGSRFRAPPRLRSASRPSTTQTPSPVQPMPALKISKEPNAPETGSLLSLRVGNDSNPHNNSKPKPKSMSAYASLCTYLALITTAVNYTPETEVLRIPSTRNTSIIGRWPGRTNHPVTELLSKSAGDGISSSDGRRTNELEAGNTNDYDSKSSRPKEHDKAVVETQEMVINLIETEANKSIQLVAREWIERAQKLSLKPASGH